jgi:hypothetical protein
MVDDAVGGVLRILAAVVLAAVLFGSLLYAHKIATASVRIGRFLRLLPAPPPTPSGHPLERIVQDLRRLQPEARHPGEGMPIEKLRGVVAAYDDLLLEACRAVEVSTSLVSLPEGLERESERLRVEYELERAGILIRTAP